jgi:hypothetical protein
MSSESGDLRGNSDSRQHLKAASQLQFQRVAISCLQNKTCCAATVLSSSPHLFGWLNIIRRSLYDMSVFIPASRRKSDGEKHAANARTLLFAFAGRVVPNLVLAV